DAALLKDIKLSKKFGFNGARLHQKVFEERFLYHCDKEGYLVWGEYPNWGVDHSDPEAVYHLLPEWIEEVNRDFNHPAIIGWCPLNETWDYAGRRQFDPYLSLIYRTTKAIDTTRPCIDTSGNYHVETDIFDVHDYEQNPEVFAANYADLEKKGEIKNHCNNRQTYEKGKPIFVSEYGGIKWSRKTETGPAWGYGNAPETPEEYHERYKGLTDVLLDNPLMFGFCYTQLTDVEQEQNGCYYYDRSEKFDTEYFYKVNSRKAAIED
ncbi:MAG: beta-galactosidase, partial [Clostridia bacterium]|nr:beta-galactosidase [Clostridia bacterium]